MKQVQWKLLVLMALPISLLALLPNLMRDPTPEIERQMPGIWHSTVKQETLMIHRSSTGIYVLLRRQQSMAQLRAQLRADLAVMPGRRDGPATLFYFVDASHLRTDRKSSWMPKGLVHVSINGDMMLLDPSNGKDASKISEWIRV